MASVMRVAVNILGPAADNEQVPELVADAEKSELWAVTHGLTVPLAFAQIPGDVNWKEECELPLRYNGISQNQFLARVYVCNQYLQQYWRSWPADYKLEWLDLEAKLWKSKYDRLLKFRRASELMYGQESAIAVSGIIGNLRLSLAQRYFRPSADMALYDASTWINVSIIGGAVRNEILALENEIACMGLAYAACEAKAETEDESLAWRRKWASVAAYCYVGSQGPASDAAADVGPVENNAVKLPRFVIEPVEPVWMRLRSIYAQMDFVLRLLDWPTSSGDVWCCYGDRIRMLDDIIMLCGTSSQKDKKAVEESLGVRIVNGMRFTSCSKMPEALMLGDVAVRPGRCVLLLSRTVAAFRNEVLWMPLCVERRDQNDSWVGPNWGRNPFLPQSK